VIVSSLKLLGGCSLGWGGKGGWGLGDCRVRLARRGVGHLWRRHVGSGCAPVSEGLGEGCGGFGRPGGWELTRR
jgi:hypothetical protein